MPNITQTGPKGYEYQYIVSLLIALQQIQINEIEVYIEAIGIEDAFLKIKRGDAFEEIEIQIKSENKLLELSTLTEWLYHFEARGVENLLQKIISGSIGLFVTQSRCSDGIHKFKKEIPSITKHENFDVKLKDDWFSNFKKYLGENKFVKGKTDLAKSRDKVCQSQVEYIDTEEKLVSIFSNVIIWDEVSIHKLDYQIELILNRKFKIPQSRCSDIRREMYECVLKGRDLEVDVIPFLEDVIKRNELGKPQFKEEFYRKRKGEDAFVQKLEKSNLLLLTGTSFCGKTELAKSIANHFFEKGFNYKISDNIQSLQEFYNQNREEDKIAILEDVWGHIEVDVSSETIKRKLNNLVANLPVHHKLIVTSRTEILKNAFLEFPCINNSGWNDLTIIYNKELVEYWMDFANRKDLSISIIDLVKSNLVNSIERHQLQIGQLEHLANQDKEYLEGKTFDELLHIARQESIEIADILRTSHREAADLISIIAICTNTIQSISKEDLAYILNGGDKFYSINEQLFSSFGGDEENEEINKYFEYDSTYDFTENQLNSLEILEEKSYLRIDDGCIIFTHPNYYEAGRYLFKKRTENKQNNFFTFFRRAIFCINPDIAFLAASQLNVIINKIDSKYLSKIYGVSEKMSKSVFPAIKDISVIFRIRNIGKFEKSQQDSILKSIPRSNNYINYINWYENIPYIRSSSSFSRYFSNFWKGLDLDKVIHDIENGRVVSKREAYALVNSKKDNLSSHILNHLMKYDDGFIREETVAYFFERVVSINDKELIDNIFIDDHPSVVYAAVRGCFIEWTKYSIKLKEYLLEKLKEAMANQFISVRSSRLITNFGIDYAHDHIWRNQKPADKSEIWKLWSILFPIFIEQLPVGIYINTPRFGSTMDEAIKYLNVKEGIDILDSWYGIVNKEGHSFWNKDSYTLSIMYSLISCTKDDWKARESLFDKLLAHRNTSFVITSVSWAISFWETYLHEIEKEKIISLTKSDRQDALWIKATLIILKQDERIAKAIFENSDFFNGSISSFYDGVPESLLKSCIQLLFGENDGLWDLPTQGVKSNTFWMKFVRYVLENQISPLFEFALNKFFWYEVNGNHLFDDCFQVWRIICNSSYNKEELTKYLIYSIGKSNFNYEKTKEIFSILIGAFKKDGDLDLLLKVVSENIDVLQLHDSDGFDLIEIFDDEIFNAIISSLELDKQIFAHCNFRVEASKKLDETALVNLDKYIASLLNDFDSKVVKLKFTMIHVKNFIKRNNIHSDLENTLSAFVFIHSKSDILNRFDVNLLEREELPNWVF